MFLANVGVPGGLFLVAKLRNQRKLLQGNGLLSFCFTFILDEDSSAPGERDRKLLFLFGGVMPFRGRIDFSRRLRAGGSKLLS